MIHNQNFCYMIASITKEYDIPVCEYMATIAT